MKKAVTDEIKQLKAQTNAIILAHYYAPAEAQAVADYVGDSYYLAKVAKGTAADTVVFCGVGFMGESVKILNPDKTVLMPDPTADCPMAHMVDVKRIEAMRETYPDLAVVCYINSTAALKCHSDVCVTSSNAIRIVKELPNQNIFFIPDQNLGRFVAEQLPEKNIILNDGYCPIHAAISAERIKALKTAHPKAEVLAHPECRPEILALSDRIGSTAEILTFAKESDARELIICTEDGVSYALERQNPNKTFYYVTEDAPCTDMKRNTPERILHALKTGDGRVEIDEDTRQKAMRPLERMLELAK